MTTSVFHVGHPSSLVWHDEWISRGSGEQSGRVHSGLRLGDSEVNVAVSARSGPYATVRARSGRVVHQPTCSIYIFLQPHSVLHCLAHAFDTLGSPCTNWMNIAMDWTFNLRTPCYSGSDDEDSSSETEQTTVSDNSSSLLAELDLSGRQDTACHKPNPWTIARINATTRQAIVGNGNTEGPEGGGRKRITSSKPVIPTSFRHKTKGNKKDASREKGYTAMSAVCHESPPRTALRRLVICS